MPIRLKTASNLGSNIRKLGFMKFFQSCSIMMPVITLFYQENGLDLYHIFLLQSIFAFAVFVFEVPIGYFGDRVGTKNSIVIGSVLIALGFLVYARGTGFIDFMRCEILLALGFSFISGSDTALLYETLKIKNRTDAYKKIEGKINFIGEATGALGGIIGGIIAHYYSFRATMLMEGIMVAFAIPFALSLVNIVIQAHNKDISLRRNIRNVIRYSLHHNQRLKWIILLSAVLSTASMCVVRAMQPYLKQIGFPVLRFGLAWFGLRGIVSLSSLCAHRRDKKMGLRRGLLGLLGFGVSGYLIAGLNPYESLQPMIGIIIGLCGLSLLHIQRGLQKPITNHAINELAESDIRATVLSVNSMISRLGYAMLGPCIGWLGDLYDLQTMFLLSALIFGSLGLIAFTKLFYSKHSSTVAQ